MKPRMLITGATSGIGAALAARYAGRADLLLAGRRQYEAAAATLPANANYVVADQSEPERAAAQIGNALASLGWDTLDVAVLNAGTGWSGDPATEPAASIRNTLDANLFAAVTLSHALAARLEGGQLVLVGSTARRGAPQFASYAAAKAGLDGLARALSEEWRGKVRVKIIHPGPTATGMHAKAGFDTGRARALFAPPEMMARLIERAIVGRRIRRTISFPQYLAAAVTPWRR